MTKLTRRELAAASLAAAAASTSAQTQPAANQDDLAMARKRVADNAAALNKLELPMSTEPAFLFKA